MPESISWPSKQYLQQLETKQSRYNTQLHHATPRRACEVHGFLAEFDRGSSFCISTCPPQAIEPLHTTFDAAFVETDFRQIG